MINQMNEIQNYEDLEDENYSDSQSYYKTIFNSRVINSIYTGHNTLNLNKTNSTLTDNKSVENFLDKITYFEKKAKEEKEKNSKNKSKKKEEKNKMNKNEEPNINKNNSNLFVNSILTPSNNSFLKNKINKYIKKNILDNYLNNAINNNKLMFKQINIITKQKSFSNFVSNNNNKKIYASIKHNNFIKKNKNYYNYSSIEPNILLSKQNISNILNNISESYRSNSNNNINSYFDFDKYKKMILSTNNTSFNKILTERVFSSPGRRKNVMLIKKKYKSNSKRKSQIKNYNNNNNLKRRNINTNIFNKIQKNLSKNKSRINGANSNNYFKEEKKVFKCQINKQNKKKLINNFHPDSVNKLYSNNLTNLNIKNKNNKNNSTFHANKNRIVNNYNIMNGIMNNSTQINIYTGNDLIKSLNLYWNSIINSSKSPSIYDNLKKKKNGSKSLSKKNKKIKNKNLKKFIESHMKEKKHKEPYTERNSNNEKFLKLLDIYCRDAKKYKSTNLKKNKNKNKLNKSHNFNYNNKSILEVKSMGEVNKKFSNNDLLKDKEKYNNYNMSHLIFKKFSFYKNKGLKEGKKYN